MRFSSARALAVAVALAGGCGGASRLPEARLDMRRHLSFTHQAELFQAANGMFVILVPDRQTNLVRVDLRMRVGSSEDPAGKGGLAHMVEHMVYEARPGGPEQPTIEQQLSQVALWHNAYTNLDQTQYSSVASADQLEALLAVETARLSITCDQLDERLLAREREVVRNELRERSGVGMDLQRTLQAALYPAGHPYARLPGGSDVEVASMTREDVCAFFQAHYAPSRAILAVSGNLDVAATSALVARTLGRVPAREPAPRAAIARVAPRGTTSRHELPIEEATAFIAFPDLAWNVQHHQIAMTLLERRLATVDALERYITDTTTGEIGGDRASYSYVAISVADAERLDDAVDRVFKEIVALSRRSFGSLSDATEARAIMNEARERVISASEPLGARGSVFADYLMNRPDNTFMVRDLAELQRLRAGDVRYHLEISMARDRSHVALVRPNPSVRATEERATLPPVGTIDDRDPLDTPHAAEEAEQPIAIGDARRRSGVRELAIGGLRVLLAPGMSYPVIDLRLVLPVGSLHDPPGATGTAHLAGLLLKYDVPDDLSRDEAMVVADVFGMGGVTSAEVDEDSTTFRNRGLATFADGLLWELCWWVGWGTYDDDTLYATKQRVRRAARENADEERQAAVIRQALYGAEHPYARGLEVATEVGRLGKADLQRFRAAHHSFAGATLIVAGTFDPADLERRIRRLLGRRATGSAPPAPPRVPAAQRGGPVHLALADEEEPQVILDVQLVLPTGFRDSHAERMILREMFDLRLSRLRDRLGSTYGVSVSLTNRAGPGVLEIAASVDRERVTETFAALRAEIASLLAADDLAATFIHARRRVLENVLARTASSSEVAGELEFIAQHRLPLDYFDQLAHRIAALTLSRHRAWQTTALDSRGMVTLVRGPRAVVEEMARAAGVTDLRFVD